MIPLLQATSVRFEATDIDVSLRGVSHLDVRDFPAVETVFARLKPSIVIHLAAETDVDKCEEDPRHAYETNTLGTQNVAICCNRFKVPLAYVSTAGVFNGTKNDPYTEFDSPDPINVYGRSKYQGEVIVRSLVSWHFIIRAGWMIGGGERDKKFVGKILKQLSEGRREIYAVRDKLGTPTYAKDFCELLLKLIATPFWGTYHMACKGTGTRFDVAAHIVRSLGLDEVKVIPVTSDYFREEYPAPRPKSEAMENLMLELRGMNSVRHWKEALTEYIGRYHKVTA